MKFPIHALSLISAVVWLAKRGCNAFSLRQSTEMVANKDHLPYVVLQELAFSTAYET